jgi:hypothetical protein
MPLDRFGFGANPNIDARHLQQCMQHQRCYIHYLQNRIQSFKARRLSEEGNSLGVLNTLREQLREVTRVCTCRH